jgi:hypothetical protein
MVLSEPRVRHLKTASHVVGITTGEKCLTNPFFSRRMSGKTLNKQSLPAFWAALKFEFQIGGIGGSLCAWPQQL